MRQPYRALLGVGAVLMLLLIGAGLYFEGNGQLRFLAGESRLGFLETRISSVEEEFMRRSRALRENFSRFDTCMSGPDCDPVEILIERDRILREVWGEMLPRLLINDDWGEGTLTIANRERFQRDIQEAGGAVRAQACAPLIEYWLLSQSQETAYRYKGLRCPVS